MTRFKVETITYDNIGIVEMVRYRPVVVTETIRELSDGGIVNEKRYDWISYREYDTRKEALAQKEILKNL